MPTTYCANRCIYTYRHRHLFGWALEQLYLDKVAKLSVHATITSGSNCRAEAEAIALLKGVSSMYNTQIADTGTGVVAFGGSVICSPLAPAVATVQTKPKE